MLRKMSRQPQFAAHAGWIAGLRSMVCCLDHVRKNSAWPERKTQAMRSCPRSERFRGNLVFCARKALWFVIARLRGWSLGYGRLSAKRALHITGVTLVEDRGRDRSQANFTVLIPTNRVGLLVR